jgi:hypothetical protein
VCEPLVFRHQLSFCKQRINAVTRNPIQKD